MAAQECSSWAAAASLLRSTSCNLTKSEPKRVGHISIQFPISSVSCICATMQVSARSSKKTNRGSRRAAAAAAMPQAADTPQAAPAALARPQATATPAAGQALHPSLASAHKSLAQSFLVRSPPCRYDGSWYLPTSHSLRAAMSAHLPAALMAAGIGPQVTRSKLPCLHTSLLL